MLYDEFHQMRWFVWSYIFVANICSKMDCGLGESSIYKDLYFNSDFPYLSAIPIR